MKSAYTYLLTVTLLAALAGCGDDKATGGGDAGLPEGDAAVDAAPEADGGGDASVEPIDESTEETINAAAGGSIELLGASLAIPGDSVDVDAESVDVTLRATTPSDELPGAEDVLGLFYEFGPEGLDFYYAAELRLPRPEGLGANEYAVISYYDAERESWDDLATWVDGDELVAYIKHFSAYAARRVDSDECVATDCGGTVGGYWSAVSLCAPAVFDGEHPYESLCNAGTFERRTDVTDGWVSFSAEQSSTFVQWNIETTQWRTFSIPSTCFPSIYDVENCAALAQVASGDLDTQVTCTTTNTGCDCESEKSPPAQSTGWLPYTAEGGVLSVEWDEETGSVPAYACVSAGQNPTLSFSTDGWVMKALPSD